MRAGRTALTQFVHDLLKHAPTIALTLRARQKINVKVRGILLVRFGTKVVGIMIPRMNPLNGRPFCGITQRRRKLRAGVTKIL